MTMAPQDWFSSHDCRSGVHCSTCQDPGESGQRFRRLAILNGGFTGFPPDGDAPVCPYGMKPPPLDGLDVDERELMEAANNPEGWGDHVAAAIHKLGADRAYKLVRKSLGLVESCGGCNARRKALNRLEGWVKRVFGG